MVRRAARPSRSARPKQIDVEIKGAVTARKQLSEVGIDLADFRPFYEEAYKKYTAEVRRIFRTKRDGTWKPLSPEYAKRKRQEYPTKPLMRRTDKLWKAATGQRPKVNQVKKIRKTSAVFGVNDERIHYAKYAGAKGPFYQRKEKRNKCLKQ